MIQYIKIQHVIKTPPALYINYIKHKGPDYIQLSSLNCPFLRVNLFISSVAFGLVYLIFNYYTTF
jgi:hypothetical protein